jgi:hypothetical protein
MVQASNKLFCLSKQALIVVIVTVYKLRKVHSLCCLFIECCYYCYCRFISWFIDFMRWGVVFHKLLKGSYLFLLICLFIDLLFLSLFIVIVCWFIDLHHKIEDEVYKNWFFFQEENLWRGMRWRNYNSYIWIC